jgi:hypothetical protein
MLSKSLSHIFVCVAMHVKFSLCCYSHTFMCLIYIIVCVTHYRIQEHTTDSNHCRINEWQRVTEMLCVLKWLFLQGMVYDKCSEYETQWGSSIVTAAQADELAKRCWKRLHCRSTLTKSCGIGENTFELKMFGPLGLMFVAHQVANSASGFHNADTNIV